MPNKDPIKEKENKAKYRLANKEKNIEYQAKRREDLNQHAIDSIASDKIIDANKWNLWCNTIKSNANKSKHPYSIEFTNDVMFDMMKQGCYYCGNIATTIDRLDSTLSHIIENCVGCCWECNNSKGAADPATFIRKAYYNARGNYIDDITDIWFVNKNKPRWDMYKKKAERKKVPFKLTKEEFDSFIIGNCAYCKRSPTTWFGIDRIIPSEGYILNNIVSCCYDCNINKHINDINSTIARNNQIASRVDAGKLSIEEYKKVIVHIGIQKSSNKVCAYGQIYDSKIDASRALGKSHSYVCDCIKKGIHSKDIFEI